MIMGSTHVDGPLANSFLLNLIAISVLDRPGNTGTHPEMVIRRVDDRVYGLDCDIALNHFDRGAAYIDNVTSRYRERRIA